MKTLEAQFWFIVPAKRLLAGLRQGTEVLIGQLSTK